MRIINKIALAVISKKKVLMVRSSDQEEVFYTLGGKIKEGELDLDCLKREVWEEVGCKIDEDSVKFLTVFEDVAHGKDETLLNLRFYEGKLLGEPKPSSEIVEIGWFDTKSDKKHLSLIAQRTIFPWLRDRGYIN